MVCQPLNVLTFSSGLPLYPICYFYPYSTLFLKLTKSDVFLLHNQHLFIFTIHIDHRFLSLAIPFCVPDACFCNNYVSFWSTSFRYVKNRYRHPMLLKIFCPCSWEAVYLLVYLFFSSISHLKIFLHSRTPVQIKTKSATYRHLFLPSAAL